MSSSCLCKSATMCLWFCKYLHAFFTMGNCDRHILSMHFLLQVNNLQVAFESACTQQPACIMIDLFKLFVCLILWCIFGGMSDFFWLQAFPCQRCCTNSSPCCFDSLMWEGVCKYVIIVAGTNDFVLPSKNQQTNHSWGEWNLGIALKPASIVWKLVEVFCNTAGAWRDQMICLSCVTAVVVGTQGYYMKPAALNLINKLRFILTGPLSHLRITPRPSVSATSGNCLLIIVQQ